MKKTTNAKPQVKRTNYKPMSVGGLALQISRKCFGKYGFNGPEMFFHWPYIVGEDLYPYCRPSRINWPKGTGQIITDRLNSATLVINCLGAFALEIESNSPAILQRANMIFGYAAIGKMRVKQHQTLDFLHILEKEVEQAIELEPPQAIIEQTHDVKNEDLRNALNGLGTQIYHNQITKK